MSTGLIFDGIGASECVDSSGERISLLGLDDSNWKTPGGMMFNFEHKDANAKDVKDGASTLVGRVIYAKKIYTLDDCENDRQRKYYNEIKTPLWYVVGRLFDGAGHENAKQIAAIMRDNVANGEEMQLRLSIEGSTLSMKDGVIESCIARKIAITAAPCNRTAVTDIIEDPNAPEGFSKVHAKEDVKDLLDLEDAEKNEISVYRKLGASLAMSNPVVDEGLVKSLEAGSYNAAPSSLTGGAALQVEHLGSNKDRALLAARKYLAAKAETKTDFDKAEFRSFIKHKLNPVSDEFLDHFADAVEQVHVKRSQLAKKESNKEAIPAKKPIPAKKSAAKLPAAKAKQPTVDEEDASPVKISNGTIRGIPVQPMKMKGYQFDEERGILHTPKGSFPLYNPDKGFQTVTHKSAKKPFYKGGVLHVAPGADLKTIPHNEANPGFRDIYNSQPIEDFHSDKVMPNWLRVHELTKAGQLPEEVVMHSAMFSMMSPNTPIRSHELMYSHLADTFEDLGIDARDPDFKKARKHWLGKDKPHNYPKTAGDYFRNHPDIHLANASEEKGRKAGDLKSFMLGPNKFKNVEQYSNLHQTLLDVIKRHGVDSRGAANELMSMKAKQILWKNQRRAVKNKAKAEGMRLGLKNHATEYIQGKEAAEKAAGNMGKRPKVVDRVPGEDDDDETPMRWDPRFLPEAGENIHPSIYYSPQRAQAFGGDTAKRKQWAQEAEDLGLKDDLEEHAERAAFDKVGPYKGTVVPGLAPKTGRFTFTMLGGGNSFVPDTHMVRHMFGMDSSKDGHSLAYLKSILWNAKNSNVLEGMDRWYAKNHPAAQLMQQHPKWGPAFKDDPEQANFPAFWRHWSTIAQDEGARGIDNSAAQNEFSTHEPFWMGIDKFVNPVKKSEDALEPHMIAKMLAMHSQYEKDYGEVPAQMMFFQHIIPHLIEAGQHREKHDDLSDFVKMAKLHSLEIELKKSVNDLKLASFSDPRIPSVHAVYRKINGNEHRAGRFMLVNNEMHHLEDPYGILGHFLPEGPMNLKTVSTIHGMKMSPSLDIRVEQPPEKEPTEPNVKIGLQPAAAVSAGRPSVFHYQRAGMDRPHTLEVNQGKYTLDGSELSIPEVQTMLGNAKTGAATIRYKKSDSPVGQIAKMEEMFAGLVKAEEHLPAQDYLAHIRDLEDRGIVKAGTSEGFSRHLYEDPLTGLGNQKAWQEFKTKNKPGVYVGMDGNSFSQVNNAFGHQVGDQAIQTYGHAMRDAMTESGNHGKLFRAGGDEINAHFPSHEHAAHFARKLHEKLEAVPPIQGVHKLSVAMGLGTSPEHADKALYAAKAQKYLPGQEGVPDRDKKKAFKVGQEPNFAHSLVQGHEGPVPLHDHQAEALHSTLKEPSVPVPSTV